MSKRFRIWALALAAALILAFLFRVPLLRGIGGYLVQAGPPDKADLILVLAGDSYGDRILKAASLVREGYAPRVVVSGPYGMYGLYECELAIQFAVKHGYPESYFVHAEHNARSTVEEARDVVPQLRTLQAHTVLLVTSDFHTRRAARIFRATAPDMRFVVVAATGPEFSVDAWWKNRQGRKIAFNEWAKTVAEWLGI